MSDADWLSWFGAYGINELPLEACVTSGSVSRIDESNGKMADFTVGLLNCTSVSCLIGIFYQRILSAWRLHLPLLATLYFIRV